MRIPKAVTLALGVVLMAGCGPGPHVATQSPPVTSPTPTGVNATLSPTNSQSASTPLGIVIKDFLTGGPNYTVSLVSLDGRVVASAMPSKRSHPAGVLVQMPNVSASDTRLYFLDGDSKIKFLNRDGTTGTAATIPLDGNSAAVFSVSPDDARIAVAVITFPYPARTRIYVEDLSGAGHHADIFSSKTELEWPAGWHEGHLVIAVGLNVMPQNGGDWFNYGYRGYHVADATTGARLATVCDGFDASLPPVPAGTVCENAQTNLVSDWTGASRPIREEAACGGALSPDGSLIAGCHGDPRTTVLVARDGSLKPTSIQATPVGWMDGSHLVVRTNADGTLQLVDLASLAPTPLGTQGFFAGMIPGHL